MVEQSSYEETESILLSPRYHQHPYFNPFAAVLTSYLVMRKLCALMTSVLVLNPIAVMLSVAHRVAEISLLVGTWHAVGYLWGVAPNVTEIPPGSWQQRG